MRVLLPICCCTVACLPPTMPASRCINWPSLACPALLVLAAASSRLLFLCSRDVAAVDASAGRQSAIIRGTLSCMSSTLSSCCMCGVASGARTHECVHCVSLRTDACLKHARIGLLYGVTGLWVGSGLHQVQVWLLQAQRRQRHVPAL